MTRKHSRRLVYAPVAHALAAVFGAWVFGGSVAVGQLPEYNVQHAFTFNPPPGFTGVPIVTGYYFQHAWVREVTPGGWLSTWDVDPPQPNPLFDPLGYELIQSLGALNVPTNGGSPTSVQYGSFIIPPGGYNNFGCTLVQAQNCFAWATACTQFVVQPFGAGTPIQGMYRASGGVNTGNCRIVETYAFSSAAMTIAGASPTGQILWTVTLEQVSGGIFRRRIAVDPIKITARDGLGNSASAIALDIVFENDGPGGIDWTNGVITIDARDSALRISMDPAVTIGGGDLLLETDGGVVTQSIGTGQFANWALPPVGTVVPFTSVVPADIVVNYDASGLVPGRIVQTNVDLLGGGGMPDSKVCAADFNGDTEVDFFDYLDFVAAFSEGHPAADFNSDGEIDFFDYLDFVAAFSEGC